MARVWTYIAPGKYLNSTRWCWTQKSAVQADIKANRAATWCSSAAFITFLHCTVGPRLKELLGLQHQTKLSQAWRNMLASQLQSSSLRFLHASNNMMEMLHNNKNVKTIRNQFKTSYASYSKITIFLHEVCSCRQWHGKVLHGHTVVWWHLEIDENPS